jgi:HNH endonuclease
VKRPCLKCERPIPSGSYCPQCKPRPHDPGRLRGSRGQKLRKAMLAAYGYRCAECGASGVRLEVHHMNGDETDNSPGNLVVLCKKHHARANLRLF